MHPPSAGSYELEALVEAQSRQPRREIWRRRDREDREGAMRLNSCEFVMKRRNRHGPCRENTNRIEGGRAFLPLPRAMPSRVGEDLRLEALRGGAASAAACLLSNPIDVVRCRLQLEGGRSSLFHSTGMASSLPAAMAYNVVMNSTRFALFASLSSNTDRPLTSGLLAGGVAGLVSSPLARLRTLQQAGDHMFASAARATAAAPFSGAGIWSLRNAGHTACIFYLYEAALRRLSVRLDGAGVPPLVLYLSASLCASVTSCLLMNPLDVLATRAFHAPPANAAALAAGFHTPTHLNTPVAARARSGRRLGRRHACR